MPAAGALGFDEPGFFPAFDGRVAGVTQARYFFPILPAAIVLAIAGLGSLIPARWQLPATVVLVAGAGLFQTLILMKLVLPYAYL